ncbi:MAG TPA: PAS domain-containing protein [Methanospirillum sp.]|uniref:PAS domain-containing protein n=1 Tax=Methanospirillum sp. TaxID=45200 RepID=UPI002C82D588|nr:PAS domain-containing protein [Methanospirillum sp.]HOJ95889.1 PAS domain-containing protein [Methanospirillum sp.]
MADNPEGISIHEVAEKMGIHRNTAAKYLEILHSQGLVEVKKVGVTKLYTSSRRIPVSCVLHLFSEPVFGVDRGNVIRAVNTAALEMIGLSRKECIGRSLTLLDELICTGISEGSMSSLRVLRVHIPLRARLVAPVLYMRSGVFRFSLTLGEAEPRSSSTTRHHRKDLLRGLIHFPPYSFWGLEPLLCNIT